MKLDLSVNEPLANLVNYNCKCDTTICSIKFDIIIYDRNMFKISVTAVSHSRFHFRI